jgi:hypothetical protein
LDSNWRNLYSISSLAALVIAVLFLIAILDLITADIQTGTKFYDNFLILIFKLHAWFNEIQEAPVDCSRTIL